MNSTPPNPTWLNLPNLPTPLRVLFQRTFSRSGSGYAWPAYRSWKRMAWRTESLGCR